MAYTERFVTDAASGGDGNDNLGITLVNATYDHTGNGEGERHLSVSAGFSSYTFTTGDEIYLLNAAGGIVVPALYVIASKVDNDAILLSANSDLTADSTADVDSSAGPWTLAESLTNAVAADSVNIQSDSGYSLGADTVSNAGTISDLIRFRGYNLVRGDLEGQGYNSDGSLNTTNFPDITLTGALTPNAYVIFEAIDFTAALSGEMIVSSSLDNWGVVQCRMVNTQNNSLAACIRFDINCYTINSDFECSGAAHSYLINADVLFRVIGCRFKLVAASACVKADNDGIIIGNVFIGNSGVGIGITCGSSSQVIGNNTFYNLNQGVTFPNAAMIIPPLLFNNHVTDCGEYINSLYSATADLVVLEFNNRTRDNTTPRTGVGDGINVDEITTDTGGIATDYTAAGSDDLTLISSAPGAAAAMRPFNDCGGLQRLGAGVVRLAGMGGGLVG